MEALRNDAEALNSIWLEMKDMLAERDESAHTEEERYSKKELPDGKNM